MTAQEYHEAQEKIRKYNSLDVIKYLEKKYKSPKVATYHLNENNKSMSAFSQEEPETPEVPIPEVPEEEDIEEEKV